MAGCIFVQNVEAPALAVTVPVLTRGLNDKNEEVKRTCCGSAASYVAMERNMVTGTDSLIFKKCSLM